MLTTGTRAPDFRVFSTDGTRVSLADFRGQRLVLFFFPRAFGPGATVEARRFRDSAVALAASGVALLGVSPDTHSRQCDFARAERLPFPLVADAEGTLCRAYGARGTLWPLVHSARRVAYVLDEAGRIEAVFGGATFDAGPSAARQVDAVLAFLKASGGRVRSLHALPSPAGSAASSAPRAAPRLRLVHSA
jgi:thioredoxin-dependent peroxiredoxin